MGPCSPCHHSSAMYQATPEKCGEYPFTGPLTVYSVNSPGPFKVFIVKDGVRHRVDTFGGQGFVSKDYYLEGVEYIIAWCVPETADTPVFETSPVPGSGGGAVVTPQEIQDAVDAYLAANPITSDVSTLTDNGDGTFTHTANGVATTIDMTTTLGQIPAATLSTLITNAITNNPNAIITALAAASNLIPIEDLAGVQTHQAFPPA